MNFLKHFPAPNEIKTTMSDIEPITRKSNTHIHSPYSYSAFESIEQSLFLAAEEHVDILGINDFYITDG
jgi:hypothetical protein